MTPNQLDTRVEDLKTQIVALYGDYRNRRFELGMRLIQLQEILAHPGNTKLGKFIDTVKDMKIPVSTAYELIKDAKIEAKRLKQQSLYGNRKDSEDCDVDLDDPDEVEHLLELFRAEAEREHGEEDEGAADDFEEDDSTIDVETFFERKPDPEAEKLFDLRDQERGKRHGRPAEHHRTQVTPPRLKDLEPDGVQDYWVYYRTHANEVKQMFLEVFHIVVGLQRAADEAEASEYQATDEDLPACMKQTKKQKKGGA